VWQRLAAATVVIGERAQLRERFSAINPFQLFRCTEEGEQERPYSVVLAAPMMPPEEPMELVAQPDTAPAILNRRRSPRRDVVKLRPVYSGRASVTVTSQIRIPPDIQNYLDEITNYCPGIREIWLIGSRAYGKPAPSDWDFLAFADLATLKKLQATSKFIREDIDFLVVYDGNQIKQPWRRPRDNARLTGNLKRWGWEHTPSSPTAKLGYEEKPGKYEVPRIWQKSSP
jgi:hypothetical protein